MESAQEQMGRAKMEQAKLAAEKAWAPTCEAPGGAINMAAKQMNARDRLVDILRNRKDDHLRKLVILQRAEDQLSHLRLAECEAVQEFLDLLAQSGY